MTDDFIQPAAADELTAKYGEGNPFAAAMRATRMPMIITDPRQADNPIIFANDAFLRLTGYARDEVMGRNCRFLQGPDTDPQAVARIREALAQDHDLAVDILNYRKDGSTFWNALYVSPVRNGEHAPDFFFASQVDVSDKKNAEVALRQVQTDLEGIVAARTAELRQSVEQKTSLLHEVDHRVKNNLQLIASLMLLQTRRVKDPAVKRALGSMLERVNAVATVHRRLFQSDDVAMFDVAAFVRDLADDTLGAAGRSDIKIVLSTEPAQVPASLAAPLALVINELLINAIAHGFPPGRGGEVRLGVHRKNNVLRIEIADDGVGMLSKTDSAVGDELGFGLTIVDLLSRQLRGRCERSEAGPGVKVTLELPMDGVG